MLYTSRLRRNLLVFFVSEKCNLVLYRVHYHSRRAQAESRCAAHAALSACLCDLHVHSPHGPSEQRREGARAACGNYQRDQAARQEEHRGLRDARHVARQHLSPDQFAQAIQVSRGSLYTSTVVNSVQY